MDGCHRVLTCALSKEAIEDMLLRLRIMGKFLGYLVFYPYNYTISSFLVKELVLIRNTVSTWLFCRSVQLIPVSFSCT